MLKKKRGSRTTHQRVDEETMIRRRANYSLAVLGMAFVRNGSGRFLNIRASGDRLRRGTTTERALVTDQT